MKNRFLLLIIVSTLCIGQLYSQQDTINIGTSNNVYASPWGGGCQYSFQQFLYTVSQIGRSGEIKSFSFQKSSGSMGRNLTIYMGYSNKNSFQSYDDIIHTDSLTLVYHGYTNTSSNPNWDQINLTTPFYYNGVENLIISIIDSTGTLTVHTNLSTDINSKQHLILASSVQPINPNNPVYQHSAISEIALNTRFIFEHDTISCPIPSRTFSNITYSGCTMSWANSTCCDHRNIGIKESNTFSWTYFDIQNSNSIILDSLNMRTKYDVVFRNINNLGDTTAWVYSTFTTICGPCTRYPLKENFDYYGYEYSVYPPPCWSSLFPSQATHIANYFPYSLPFSFRFSNNDIITIPKIEEPINLFSVRLRVGSNVNNNNSVLQIGCMSDTNNASTFIVIDTIQMSLPNYWQEIYVDLQNAPTTHKYIAFRGYGNQFFIDDVEVDFTSICDRVMYPSIDTVTAHTATFSWTSLNQETTWEIAYGLGSFNPDMCSTIAIATSNPYTLTGLIRDTSYTAYIRSVCSPTSKSEWSPAITFHTTFADCQDPTQLYVVPSSIGAHTAQIQWNPTGNESKWEIWYLNSSLPNPDTIGSFVYSYAPSFTLTNLANDSYMTVFIRSVCDSIEKGHWIGPLHFETLMTDCPRPSYIYIPDSTITATTAKIHWRNSLNAQSYIIAYRTGSFHPDYSSCSTVTVSDTTVTLTGLIPNAYYTIYIRSICGSFGMSDWSNYRPFYTKFSDCPPPGFPISESNMDSVCVHWNGGGSTCLHYELIIGNVESNDTMISTIITDTMFRFQKQINSSDYFVCIRSICDTANSYWVNDTISVCGNFKISLPFVENFKKVSTQFNIRCWESQSINGSYSANVMNNYMGVTPFNGNGMLGWLSYYYPSGYQSRFVSPPISTRNFYDIKYSFAWYVSTINPDSADGMILQYSFDKMNWVDASNFIDRRASSFGLNSNQWIIIENSFPFIISNNDSIYIGLKFYADDGYHCFLDSLVIFGDYEICNPPSSISVDSITPTSSFIHWQNDNFEYINWIFSYKKSTDIEFITEIVPDTFVELTHLSPNTLYEIKVEKNCFYSESSESNMISFQTLDNSSIHFETINSDIVQVSPNPFNDFVDIKCDSYPMKELFLFDITGQLLNKYEVNNNTFTLLLTDYCSGSYILKISFDNHINISKQIIKF